MAEVAGGSAAVEQQSTVLRRTVHVLQINFSAGQSALLAVRGMHSVSPTAAGCSAQMLTAQAWCQVSRINHLYALYTTCKHADRNDK